MNLTHLDEEVDIWEKFSLIVKVDMNGWLASRIEGVIERYGVPDENDSADSIHWTLDMYSIHWICASAGMLQVLIFSMRVSINTCGVGLKKTG